MDALTMAGRRLSTLQQDEFVDENGFNKHRSLINCILRLLHNFLQPVKLGEPLSERKKALHAATLMLPQNQSRMSKLIASGYSPRLWDNAGSDKDCGQRLCNDSMIAEVNIRLLNTALGVRVQCRVRCA